MTCRKCQGSLDRVGPPETQVLFCRLCRIAHDEHGQPLVENPHILRTHLDVLKNVRSNLKLPQDLPKAVRLTMEAHMIQGLQEAYFAGLKDGLLLSLNLDYEQES